MQDIQGDYIIQTHSMGIFVINKEGEEAGYYDDIGIFVEGVVIPDSIAFIAIFCCSLHSLFSAEPVKAIALRKMLISA